MVASGDLPAQLTIGRWWRDELAEIDVLGLLDERTRLVGEARWQGRPLNLRDLQASRAKLSYLPEPHRDLELAFWSRGGADAALSAEGGVQLFTCDDMT